MASKANITNENTKSNNAPFRAEVPGPAVGSDVTPAPWAFDPIVGEAAFVAIAPALAALPGEAVTTPNVDSRAA